MREKRAEKNLLASHSCAMRPSELEGPTISTKVAEMAMVAIRQDAAGGRSSALVQKSRRPLERREGALERPSQGGISPPARERENGALMRENSLSRWRSREATNTPVATRAAVRGRT